MGRPKKNSRTFPNALAYASKHPKYAVRDRRGHKYKAFGKSVYRLKWGKRVWEKWRLRKERAGVSNRWSPFTLSEIQIPFYLLFKLIPDFTADECYWSQRFRGSTVRVSNQFGDVVITYKRMALTLKPDIDAEEALEEMSYLLDLIRRKSFGFKYYETKDRSFGVPGGS